MNFFLSLCILAAIVHCFGSTYCAHGASNETDLHALLEFKAKVTADPNGVLSSWNETIHFCQWQGVSCSHRHGGRVTKLDLESRKLAGSLSPSIGNLSFLRVLSLVENKFSHEIPQEIGRLRRLEQLYLNNNSFSGKIPSNLSSCTNLVSIRFSRNRLEGDIPKELGDLLNLRSVYMGVNNLTGNIPPSFGNLTHLRFLSIPYNNLVSRIPDSLGQLVNLTIISLAANRLSGTLPPSLFNLSFLDTFDIRENFVQGHLPPDLGISLPRLKYLSFGANNFTGRFPPSFSNATNLVDLGMVMNQFTGNLPSFERLTKLQWVSLSTNYLGTGEIDDLNFLYSMANLTALKFLAINTNNFGGVLPEIISNFTNLFFLSLSYNRISGTIPIGIRNLLTLQYLDASYNRLSGIVPQSIGKLQNLAIMDLSMNNLSGHLPPSLGNLTNLIQLYAGGNQLAGKIPPSLGQCQNLLLLNLSGNNLSDAIPPQLLTLSSLSLHLDLSNNRFSGNLPIEVGNLKSLGQLNVSGNMLSGEIPSTLGSCTSLEALQMNGNSFQGAIPSSLSSLRALQLLDLSRNNFSGQVPEFLSGFKLLHYLNLSYNNFEGLVPTEGVFTKVNSTSIEGNNKLCGGIPEFHLPSCIPTNHSRSGLTRTLKLAIGLISGLVGVSLLLSVLSLHYSRKKKRKEPAPSFSLNTTPEISYQMLYKATDGFSSVNLIGAGSFGSVFRGALDMGQNLIAVKVFHLARHGAFKSFMAECRALRNIRHRNLVKVITACSGIDYNGNDFKALVYELMVNGSLEEWLHLTSGTNNKAGSEPRKLNILQRLHVAVDVACAIEYLHHHCETPIIHCDLKPSNILLDNEMTAHVGDFGLAKFYIESSNGCSAEKSSSIGIRGTIGYAPPEYGIGNEVSRSGDVYSYGILLLEIFTGKKPTDGRFTEAFSLHNYVKNALPEKVLEILDPDLVQEVEEGISVNRTLECLVSVLGIGIACSVESPENRTSIGDVVRQLASITKAIT